jgi:hypothetical protein
MDELSDEEMHERLEFHRAFWLHVLTGCLGWSAEAAKKYADKLLEGPPVVLHEKPGHWIVNFFIPESAKNLSSDTVDELYLDLLDAIDPTDTYDEGLPNCPAISARVKQVLKAYKLPDATQSQT